MKTLLPKDREAKQIVAMFAAALVFIMATGLFVALNLIDNVSSQLQQAIINSFNEKHKIIESLNKQMEDDFIALSKTIGKLNFTSETQLQNIKLNSTHPIKIFMESHSQQINDIFIIGNGNKHVRFFFNKFYVLEYSFIDDSILNTVIASKNDIKDNKFPMDKNYAFEAMTDQSGNMIVLRWRVLDTIESIYRSEDILHPLANIVANHSNAILRINNLPKLLGESGTEICESPAISEEFSFGTRKYQGVLKCGSQSFKVIGAIADTVFSNRKFKLITVARYDQLTENLQSVIKVVSSVFIAIFIALFASLWAWIKYRKRKEELEQQNREHIIHASKMTMIGEMASGVAHEINNPLAIIIGLAESTINHINKSEKPDSIVMDRLDRIRNTGVRMSRTVKSLRALAKDDSKGKHEDFNLWGVIESVINVTAERSRNLGTEIQANKDSLKYMVTGLEAQFGQVFLNLLSNAQNAVENSPEKWIRISGNLISDVLEIYVDDSGPGFPPELAANIENAFFSRANDTKGSGLGLTSTVAILKEHGGRLRIIPRQGHTRVAISIPRSRVSPLTNQPAA